MPVYRISKPTEGGQELELFLFEHFKVVFPLVKFEHLKKILITLLDSSDKYLSREELSKRAGLSLSLLSNCLPILKELGLIKSNGVRKDYLTLTPDGVVLATCLKNDDNDTLKELAQRLIAKSKVLQKAYFMLVSNKNITPLELGIKIAEEFDKKWDSRSTYGAVGRACIDILRGLNLIDHNLKTRGKRYYGLQEDKLMPTASANKIFSMLRRIQGEVSISDVASTPKEKEEFKTLIALNLVERLNGTIFKLSVIGERLKKEIENNGRSSDVFKEVILNHKLSLVAIEKLREVGVFDWKTVGNVIEQINGEKYKDSTKKGYGTKFLTWLKKSNLVEEVSHGKYRLRDENEFNTWCHLCGRCVEVGNMEINAKDSKIVSESERESESSIEEQVISQLRDSEFDIAILNGRIFIKWEKKVGNEIVVGVEDITSRFNGKSLGAAEDIVHKDGITFIKSKS